MPDRDPDLRGEIVYRLGNIDRQMAKLVSLERYDADQRTIDGRFIAVERDVKEIKDAVGSIAEREDDRRQLRTQTFIGPIVSGVVVGITVAVLLTVLGLAS